MCSGISREGQVGQMLLVLHCGGVPASCSSEGLLEDCLSPPHLLPYTRLALKYLGQVNSSFTAHFIFLFPSRVWNVAHQA